MRTNLLLSLLSALFYLLLSFVPFAYAQSDPTSLPLLTLSDFEFSGAFRLPADDFGDSNLNYSEGPLEYNPENNSIFIVGHTHHQAIAEFSLPELVKSSEISDLNMANPPMQQFATVLGRASSGNTQDIDRIGGLKFVANGNSYELLVNAYEYYDAAADNSHTTLAIRNPDNMASSDVDGYFTFAGGAGHTSGWISPIPSVWQETLGGTHITGQSSGIPIIGRASVGPSAFVFDPLDVVGNTSSQGDISTVKLLDFSLNNPLSSDLSNQSGNNDIWTHLSRSVYGFIPPGTRSYVTIGYSGGHGPDGICYKCTPSDGSNCGGYCSVDADDNYHFYWLWDLSDLLKVKNGEMNSFDVRPYEYGQFPTPYATDQIGGGSFDPATGTLFLTSQGADREQGTYSNPPVVMAYQFSDDPGSGSGGGSSGDQTIGTLGKRIVMCISVSGEPMARFDKGGVEGKEVPIKKAIRAFRRAMKRMALKIQLTSKKAPYKAKKKSYRSALKRAKICSKGEL